MDIDVVLHAVCVACCDSCVVNYVLSIAFFLEWACVPTVATVCVFALWQVFPNYACVMSSNDGLHIVHATIADLNFVSVKNVVKFVVRRKIFVNIYIQGPHLFTTMQNLIKVHVLLVRQNCSKPNRNNSPLQYLINIPLHQ